MLNSPGLFFKWQHIINTSSMSKIKTNKNKILPWGLEYITIQNYYILFCIPRVTI